MQVCPLQTSGLVRVLPSPGTAGQLFYGEHPTCAPNFRDPLVCKSLRLSLFQDRAYPRIALRCLYRRKVFRLGTKFLAHTLRILGHIFPLVSGRRPHQSECHDFGYIIIIKLSSMTRRLTECLNLACNTPNIWQGTLGTVLFFFLSFLFAMRKILFIKTPGGNPGRAMDLHLGFLLLKTVMKPLQEEH